MNPLPQEKLENFLRNLGNNLRQEIISHARFEQIKAGTELVREGQYVKLIPIVVSGLVKVFKRYEEKELLLYYILPEESCVMSFASSIQNGPSQIFAKCEEDSEILLISTEKLAEWRMKFPEINTLFFVQFNRRYAELLDTIHQLTFNKLDTRLLNYLRERSRATKSNPIKVSHRQIAAELGTSREVISRTIKKLESENYVVQQKEGIKIL